MWEFIKFTIETLNAQLPATSVHLSSNVNNSFDQCKFPTKAKFDEVRKIVNLKKIIIDRWAFSHVYRKLLRFAGITRWKISPKLYSALISAFQKGFSCQYNLIKLCEDLKKALDDGKFAALLLMDLSKAFDCLPYDLMAAKLVAYGMSHEAVRLLMSCLRDRKQRVRLGEHTSEWMTLLKGLPQGSILEPCLFNIFLNDLMFALKHTDPVGLNLFIRLPNSLKLITASLY